MSDLVAFLRARLDKDEQSAREALPVLVTSHGTVMWPDYETFSSPALDVATAYLERFQPARVLREVEAKRMLIDELIEGIDQDFGEGTIDRHLREHRGPSASIDEETGKQEETREWVVTRQLRLLALPYADHPDYREEWRR